MNRFDKKQHLPHCSVVCLICSLLSYALASYTSEMQDIGGASLRE